MVWAWLFGSFFGWLFRVQVKLLGNIAFFVFRKGAGTIADMGSGRLPKQEREAIDESRRLAGWSIHLKRDPLWYQPLNAIV